MNAILSLLVIFIGTAAFIAIGTRAAFHFYSMQARHQEEKAKITVNIEGTPISISNLSQDKANDLSIRFKSLNPEITDNTKRASDLGGAELQMHQVPNLRERANRISAFLTMQLIAVVGWIIIQSLLFVTPISDNVPFTVKVVIETIWLIATQVFMFYLFRRIYDRFVRAVVDLEEANYRLRRATSDLLQETVKPPQDNK